MKLKISAQKKAAIKSYLRAVLASAVSYALANIANLEPQLAILVGAFAGPLVKWADNTEKEFGKYSKK
jgi:hypothetical protein